MKLDRYCGAKSDLHCHAKMSSLGLFERVLSLCKALTRDNAQHFYVDNYFTSLRSFDFLESDGIKANGSIRAKIRQCDIAEPKPFNKRTEDISDRR